MHNHYKDIRDRIAEPPKWFDEYAVPRYCDFGPDESGCIYAKEVALVHIRCQNCRTNFNVAFSRSTLDEVVDRAYERKHKTIAERIKDGSLHYGDPPNIQCCPSGPTMNCDDIKVLQYWRKDEQRKWQRDSSLEIALPDNDDYEPPITFASK